MEVLIFGGSFDPPHLGHVRLLKAALRHLRPDRAYVVPAYRSPLKPGAHADAKERLAMARLAFGDFPVRIHPYELDRGRATYTYETLRFMRKLHPGARLTFLIGSDAFSTLDSWNRPAELRRACRWVVARRPTGPVPKADALPGKFPDISSSDVRCRLLVGENSSPLVPKAVLRFIEARGLYGVGMHRWLQRHLPPRRYLHTVEVARMALELAGNHGLDREKAALAGLLHDCGRSVPAPRMARYARARGLSVPRLRAAAERNPTLLHAYIGEDLARRRFGVTDPAVLSAIRKHTLGAPRMSALDRLLYVADSCSRDRGFPEACLIRAAAGSDLGRAFALALRTKLHYALQEGAWIHPFGPLLWNRVLEEVA